MTNDQKIYQEIAKLLILMESINPKTMLLKAELNKENDSCIFNFQYVNKNGEKILTDANGISCLKIHHLLVELRQFFLSQNQPYWEGCEFQVDLETGKFEVKFIYDE